VLQQQALTLRSLLLQRSKPKPEKLRSLLRCNSKQAPEPEILRSLLRCNNKQAPELPELVAFQQQASSGASVATQAPELSGVRSLLAEQQASELEACCSKLRTYLELGACCSKLRSSPGLKACCMKEMQAPELAFGAPELGACIAASSGALRSSKLALQQAPSSKFHGTKKKKKAMPSPSSSSSFLATQRRSNTKRNAYVGPAWVQLQSFQAPSSFQIPSSLPLQAGSKLQARSCSTFLERGALAME